MPIKLKRQNMTGTSWFDSLSGMIRTTDDSLPPAQTARLDDLWIRIALVARTRWVMLGLLSLYGFFAATSFYISSFGFCFSILQTTFLILTVIGVMLYNLLLSVAGNRFRQFPYLVHIQVFIDLFFATLLIHFTGGAVSWLWPVYLLVTLESAFLFDDKKDVWRIGVVGASLYGALLAMEKLHLLQSVSMPFINKSLQDASLFHLLIWLWVAGINAAVAFIAAFLMDTIRKDHRKIKESEEALVGFIAAANDLIFCCDPQCTVIYANLACRDVLNFKEDEFGALSFSEFLTDSALKQFRQQVAKVIKGESIRRIEQQFRNREGSLIEVEMSLSGSSQGGESPVVWGVCRDITERKFAQQELYKLAHHDILTGLPNRVLLQDRLKQAKALSHRMKSQFALLFLDLDRFKIINDTLGHSVGDELLGRVAGRLTRTIRESDTVARIGGDEFIILLLNIHDRSEVSVLADKILKSLVLPFNLREHELFVTTSLGICMYPDDDEDADAILKKADIAMYHAKALGRNNYQFYNEDMDQNASRRFVISNSLRRGLEQNEFMLHYQPKVDMVTGRMVAMEALVRWQHPELGLLSPVEFIQLAEETGLIFQLGEWVLREACLQNMKWQQEGIMDIRVAVNLSGYQLQHKVLLSSIRKVLEETGMDARLLEFEITESVIMQNPELAGSILTAISDLGIHISIDDFGTGYSSLAHLKHFSVNTLKIDKSFVRDVDLSSTDAAIATAIIAMGNSLNLSVIAEGVETQAQYDFLRENNCDQVQGYLISRPLPADEILKLLKSNRQERPGHI